MPARLQVCVPIPLLMLQDAAVFGKQTHALVEQLAGTEYSPSQVQS